MFYIKFLFLFLSLSHLFCFELSRSVGRTSITLGDPIHLKVTAIKRPGERLIFPGPHNDFGEFELKDMRSFEKKEGETIIETYEYVLTLFKLGSAKIPGVKVVNAEDTSDFKITEPVEIIVKRVTVADTSDIVDIYGQESIVYGPLFYLSIIAVIIILALMVYLFDKYIRKRKKEEVKEIVTVPPEVQFEKDLNDLIHARHLEKGEVKEFHFRISEILRRYLGARLRFYALESTTSELMGMLREKDVGNNVLKLVENFCEINDPVKFAKWIPKTEESEKLIAISREIVQKTMIID